MEKIFVVIPNWNGADLIANCLESLAKQSFKHSVVVVDNGSIDLSVDIIERQFPEVHLVKLVKNTGFAGGVNVGIAHAISQGADAVALLNNDAIADKDWLKHLVNELVAAPTTGIVTSKIILANRTKLDSTGDFYTIWGLPYPRGRGESSLDAFDNQQDIFGASGGASLYRAVLFSDIGLFDEDFFAYFEDVDISFRAQLAGWRVRFQPQALVYHEQGATSGKVKGFTTYQVFKNYPLLLWKNVPLKLWPSVLPRFTLAYVSIFISSVAKGGTWPALKGIFRMLTLLPKKTIERRRIQSRRKVTSDYISSIITHDLPPNATRLRKLRLRMKGKKSLAN